VIKSRKTSPQDAAQISEWIAADENHKGIEKAEFWIPSGEKDKTFKYAVEDEQGPIFYVVGENVLRLSIQFAPNQKRRMVKAIHEFTKVMAEGARRMGYKELIFESVFFPLIRFLHKRGFRSSKSEHVYNLRQTD
jgi:hypothetical protein